MQRMINSQVEASKIGRHIADQFMDYQRRTGDTSSESSLEPEQTNINSTLHAGTITGLQTSPDSRIPPLPQSTPQHTNGTLPGYAHVQNNLVNSDESMLFLSYFY